MRKVILSLAALAVVGLVADRAEAFGRRNRGGCNTCGTAAVAAPVSSCGGCGSAVAAGYPSYYQPGIAQGYQPNGIAQAGFIPPTNMPAITPANATELKIRLTDSTTDPATVTITAGTTVRWINDGKTPRMVRSVKGDWSSNEIAPGQDFVATFTLPGSFDYYCGNSKDVKEMKSTIVVK
jgi:plastocyanin